MQLESHLSSNSLRPPTKRAWLEVRKPEPRFIPLPKRMALHKCPFLSLNFSQL